MPDRGNAWRDVLDAADERALPALYALVSVRPESFRLRLRRRGLAFLDPGVSPPPLREVDRTAEWVIAQAGATGSQIAALGGLGGVVGAPSEAVAWIVACVRLAQRLAVVYGLDPSTERGKAAVARALAAGFEASLPDAGVADLRVSDALRAVAARAPAAGPAQVGTGLVRVVARRSLRLAVGRFGRLLPVVSSGLGAVENHQVTAEIGRRMKAVLRRLAEAAGPTGPVVDAVEIVPRGGQGR